MNLDDVDSSEEFAATDGVLVSVRTSTPDTRGILQIVTGSDQQHRLREIGAGHLSSLHPAIPRRILTDRDDGGAFSSYGNATVIVGLGMQPVPPERNPSELVTRIDSLPGFRSRKYKTQSYRFSEFATTLYLDNDTIVVQSLDDLWRHVEREPIAAALDVQRTVKNAVRSGLRFQQLSTAEAESTLATCGPDQAYYNAGVLLWRRGAESERFFEAWHDEWQRFRRRDQFAFARAVAKTGTSVARLPGSYNVPVLPATQLASLRRAHILHFWMPPKLEHIRRLGLLLGDGRGGLSRDTDI